MLPFDREAADAGGIRSKRVSGVCGILAALLISGAAAAQSAGSRIDQPTPATLPPGTSTVQGQVSDEVSGADRPTGRVSPPSSLQPSTDVVQSGDSGQGGGSGRPTASGNQPSKEMR